MKRILEPELMDTPRAAAEYNAMDHAQVNQIFAQEFLAFAEQTYANDLGSLAWEVLDVGTGTALLPIELCKANADVNVVAIDDAVSMLDLAVYNLEAAGMRERITLAKVDAKSMPYGDDSIEMVIANSIHHHIPEPKVCFAEMVRVTEEGGILFARDLARPENEQTLEALVKQYAGKETAESQRLFAESLRAALTAYEVADIVESLGFDRSTVSMTSDRHWTWAAVKNGN
jgi:ubiquinone/menaquinone biosynthesis C-methylase UbiE